MAELKTKKTEASVDTFIASVSDSQKQADCRTIVDLMQTAASAPAKMWGSSIIGFGSRRVIYASGRDLDWLVVGFSPRKQNLALYLAGGLVQQADLLEQLGDYSHGKGCLYIKRLADISVPTLKKIIERSVSSADAPVEEPAQTADTAPTKAAAKSSAKVPAKKVAQAAAKRSTKPGAKRTGAKASAKKAAKTSAKSHRKAR